MSAIVKCEILGGTDIEAAYDDCRRIGEALDVGVLCEFNGVEMFWCKCKTKDGWLSEYNTKIRRGMAPEAGRRMNPIPRDRNEALSRVTATLGWERGTYGWYCAVKVIFKLYDMFFTQHD